MRSACKPERDRSFPIREHRAEHGDADHRRDRRRVALNLPTQPHPAPGRIGPAAIVSMPGVGLATMLVMPNPNSGNRSSSLNVHPGSGSSFDSNSNRQNRLEKPAK